MSQFTVKMRTIQAAKSGGESCLPDLLGEKILQNHLEFRLGEEDEIYEGYGRLSNAYPYRQYNQYTRTLQEVRVQTIILENRYIKAVFLPEYGGLCPGGNQDAAGVRFLSEGRVQDPASGPAV